MFPNECCSRPEACVCMDAPAGQANANALEALKLALPYVERIAGTCPTQPANVLKRNQAQKDAAAIRAAIAALEATPTA